MKDNPIEKWAVEENRHFAIQNHQWPIIRLVTREHEILTHILMTR